MSPFQIGDTVTASNPELMGPAFQGEQCVKDLKGDNIRFSSLQWLHHSHFRLVKPGLLTRMGEAPQEVRDRIRRMPLKECVALLDPPVQDAFQMLQHAPGAKLDAGKPQASLLQDFGLALLAVAGVGTHGVEKYSRDGWITVHHGERRYRDAGLRHQLAMGLESTDPESGLLHAAHAAWNALAALELHLRAQHHLHPFAPKTHGPPSDPVAQAPQ